MFFRGLLVFAAGCLLAGCVTAPGNVQAVGFVWLVSRDDLRAAIAADQAEPHTGMYPKRIIYVEVVSRDQVDIYHLREYPGHDTVRRIKGKWRYAGGVIVTS